MGISSITISKLVIFNVTPAIFNHASRKLSLDCSLHPRNGRASKTLGKVRTVAGDVLDVTEPIATTNSDHHLVYYNSWTRTTGIFIINPCNPVFFIHRTSSTRKTCTTGFNNDNGCIPLFFLSRALNILPFRKRGLWHRLRRNGVWRPRI